jgi:hypothetical protein
MDRRINEKYFYLITFVYSASFETKNDLAEPSDVDTLLEAETTHLNL